MQITYGHGLHGRTVIDAKGSIVGDVSEILLDDETWRVTGLRIRVRRESAHGLGFAHHVFRSSTVDVPSEAIQSVGDTVVLRREASAFAPAPEAEPGNEYDRTGS